VTTIFPFSDELGCMGVNPLTYANQLYIML